MRCCWAEAARVLTLFSLALLSSQSLLLANAEPTSSDSSSVNVFVPSSSSASAVPTSVPEAAHPTTTSEVVSEPATTSKTPSTTSSTRSSSTSSPVERTSATQAPPPTSSSDAPASTPPSSASSSDVPSSTGISSISSPSSGSSSSSTSVISATSSTSAGVTLIGDTLTAFAATATTNVLATDDSATSYTWYTATSTATGAAASGSSSSKSFFDNKGAVAGVVAVVVLIALATILMAVILAKRRAARLQDEEDMAYFERYDGPNSTNASAVNVDTGVDGSAEPEMSYASFGGAHVLDVNDEPLATHAAADAYPDRATHFGLPTLEEYSQPHGMGINFQTVVDYPPEMSSNPAQHVGYGAGYGAVAQNQQSIYQASHGPPTSQAHPYAHPSNSARMAGAPPVQFYGEAT